MYIFGGCLSNILNKSNDLIYFDFKKKIWNEIIYDNNIENIPSKRSKHTSILYENNILIFGGESENSLKNIENFHFLN